MGCSPSVTGGEGDGSAGRPDGAKFDAAAEPKTSAFKKRQSEQRHTSIHAASASAKKVSFLVDGADGLHPVVPGEGEDDPSDLTHSADDPSGINKIDHSVPTFIPLGHVSSEDNSLAGDESPRETSPPPPPSASEATDSEAVLAAIAHDALHSPMQPNEHVFGRISPVPQPHSPLRVTPPRSSPDSGGCDETSEVVFGSEPNTVSDSDPSRWRKNPLQLTSPPPPSNPWGLESSDQSGHLLPKDDGGEHQSSRRRVSFSADAAA